MAQNDRSFGRRLAEVIDSKGMSWNRLAILADTDPAAISRYVAGTYKPKMDALTRIAQALNVSMDYLCGLSPVRHIARAEDPELSLMLACAVRYALGRRTYVVSTVTDYVMDHLPQLDKKIMFSMIRDIKECQYYGHDCDKEDWMRLLAALEDAYAAKD